MEGGFFRDGVQRGGEPWVSGSSEYPSKKVAVCGRGIPAEDSLHPFWNLVHRLRTYLEAELDLCLGSADLSHCAGDAEGVGGEGGVS